MDAFASRVEERRTRSADRTDLAYYVIGHGPRVWVAPPAMGAPLVAMSRVFSPLADTCTIVTWDMRGFHRSGAPADARAYAVERHVDDMEAVLRAEKIGRFVLGGWSMAVPISLAFVERAPERVQALLLLNGPYRSAIENALPLPGAAHALTRAIDLFGERAGRLAGPLSRRFLGARGAAKLLVRAGLLARDPEFFEQILAEFALVDWSRYFVVMRQLHEHDAAHVLPEVRVPTLITTGTKDLLTPPRVAHEMQRLIAGSELLVVDGGTHYTPAEYPEKVVAAIRSFLARHEVRLGKTSSMTSRAS